MGGWPWFTFSNLPANQPKTLKFQWNLNLSQMEQHFDVDCHYKATRAAGSTNQTEPDTHTIMVITNV